MHHHIARPDQHHGRPGMPHQHPQSGQFMIDPSAQKPQPQYQRRIDPHQALLEIGGVLTGVVDHPRPDSRPRGGRDRVEIANRPVRQPSCRQYGVGTPVGGHQKRRNRQRIVQIARQDRASAHKGCTAPMGNYLSNHGAINPISA